MTWDPSTYLAHATLRERPAHELLARIQCDNPKLVYDLGCGTGNSTVLLHSRWPNASLTGVDNSDEMLDEAKQRPEPIEWRRADLSNFVPDDAPDVIYSNAAYHWVGGHESLFPLLADSLNDHGVLAIQMPANFGAKSHTILKEIAAEGPWADMVADIRPTVPVHDAAVYYEMLAVHFESLDIWYTEYMQVLEGDDPVLSWVKGTTLVPYFEKLDGSLRDEFVTKYATALREAYPKRGDGKTVYPFKRLFIVGRRA